MMMMMRRRSESRRNLCFPGLINFLVSDFKLQLGQVFFDIPNSWGQTGITYPGWPIVRCKSFCTGLQGLLDEVFGCCLFALGSFFRHNRPIIHPTLDKNHVKTRSRCLKTHSKPWFSAVFSQSAESTLGGKISHQPLENCWFGWFGLVFFIGHVPCWGSSIVALIW